MKRTTIKSGLGGGNYFSSPKPNIEFIPTGCKTLDLALGGGWAENRIANIVGDKASAKTLLCIEAASNFSNKHKRGSILYRECESAFDPQYADALGMPMERVDLSYQPETVEDMFEDLQDVIKTKHPVLYIVDSLDSLSDRAEMVRDMDQGTYGAAKAKNMSQMFRRLVRQISNSGVTLIIVSQVRSKIGVSFGRNTTRSGGRALDFYTSQVLYLKHDGTIYQTIRGMKRAIAIKVKAKVDKNKITLPYRDASFQVRFGYGVDDVPACLAYLKQAKLLKKLSVESNDTAINKYIREIEEWSDEDYDDEVKFIHELVEEHWYQSEADFMPKRKKYRR